MEKNSALCKYFLHGACSKGSACIYKHDLSAKKDNICKFYVAGNCSYGKGCRYDHVKPTNNLKSSNVNAVKPPTIRKPPNIKAEAEDKVSARKLVTLKKKKENNDQHAVNDWTRAPTFVPGRLVHRTRDVEGKSVLKDISYSKITSFNSDQIEEQEENLGTYDGDNGLLLCPFAAFRDCPYKEKCEYLHGDVCDICQRQCLHPTNQRQRKEHQDQCAARCEAEMKMAFAAQRSDGVTCSVCLEIVKEKSDISERMFGLLENCTHPFCLTCIRKWRTSLHLEKTIVRTCPICRVQSWFVTPSEIWIDDQMEKREAIEKYKSYLGTKPCKLFDQGRGECPFGTSCFYKHAFPDGTIDDSKPNLRFVEDSMGTLSVVKSSRLNEFIANRDAQS